MQLVLLLIKSMKLRKELCYYSRALQGKRKKQCYAGVFWKNDKESKRKKQTGTERTTDGLLFSTVPSGLLEALGENEKKRLIQL